jgi:Fur family peroxide stress response transcriptional regulator
MKLTHPLGGQGRRVTKQRQAILRLLRSTDCHPDAYWIYEKVRSQIPQISLGTVYRTLKVLTESGLIHELSYGNHHSRYDGNVISHAHVTCARCGRVADVPLPSDHDIQGWAGAESGFTISAMRIEFEGVCATCQSATAWPEITAQCMEQN